jgi:hypothetical protein
MITHMTRGSIELEVDGRRVTVNGEAFLPGHGSPDFVAYGDLLTAWDDGEALSEADKRAVLDDLRQSARARGITIEIE